MKAKALWKAVKFVNGGEFSGEVIGGNHTDIDANDVKDAKSKTTKWGKSEAAQAVDQGEIELYTQIRWHDWTDERESKKQKGLAYCSRMSESIFFGSRALDPRKDKDNGRIVIYLYVIWWKDNPDQEVILEGEK